MNIKPKERAIREILSSQKQYEIPRFQREYSWEKKNYKEFLEDMILNLEINGKEIKSTPYFMGTMLFVGDAENKAQKQTQVVDGQQRLTTITILFSAMSQLLLEKEEKKLSENLFKYIMTEDDNGDPIRIIKTNSSYPYFSYFIQSSDKNKAEEAKSEEEDSIKETYNYFKNELTEQNLRKALNKLKIDLNNVDYISILKAIRDQVLDSTVVEIYTSDIKLANRLFENLNAKGKQLAYIDLIKNKIFEKLDRVEPADFAQNIWKKIIDLLSSGNERIGVATFFRHYWASKYKRSTANAIYNDFKNLVKKDDYEIFLSKLYESAKIYYKIVNPSRADYNNRKEYFYLVQSLNEINKSFNVVQARVPLLAIYDAKERNILDHSKFKKIVTYLENFHFAYNAVLSKSANKIDPIYSKFAIAIRKCSNKQEASNVITELLLSPLEELYPTYEEFEKGFILLYYTKKDSPSNVKTKYVINKINCWYDNKEIFDEEGSIEHIVPESEATSNIGNLILLERKINTIAGNKSYKEKISDYSSSKYIWISKFMQDHSEWTVKDIAGRAKKMSRLYYDDILGRGRK